MPKLQYIYKNYNWDEDKKNQLLCTIPLSVNFTISYETDMTGHNKCYNENDIETRYRTDKTIHYYLEQKNTSHMCTIELSNKQNELLKQIINNDKLLNDARWYINKNFVPTYINNNNEDDIDNINNYCTIL